MFHGPLISSYNCTSVDRRPSTVEQWTHTRMHATHWVTDDRHTEFRKRLVPYLFAPRINRTADVSMLTQNTYHRWVDHWSLGQQNFLIDNSRNDENHERWHHPPTMRWWGFFPFSHSFLNDYLFLLFQTQSASRDTQTLARCEQIRVDTFYKINKYKFVVFIEPYLLPTRLSTAAHSKLIVFCSVLWLHSKYGIWDTRWSALRTNKEKKRSKIVDGAISTHGD